MLRVLSAVGLNNDKTECSRDSVTQSHQYEVQEPRCCLELYSATLLAQTPFRNRLLAAAADS